MTVSERSYSDPAINEETKDFWTAASDGKLLLKRCRACSSTHYYPRTICPRCFSQETEWYEATGRGAIYSYSVMRLADPPYAIAYVTLEEGVSMLTNIVDCDFDSITIGKAVEVTFRSTIGGQALPVFRLREAGFPSNIVQTSASSSLVLNRLPDF